MQQLFDLLDTDFDGLICFEDFVRQMAVYMTGGEDSVDNTVEQPRDEDVIRFNYEECGVTPLPQTPEHKSSAVKSSQSNLIDDLPPPTMIDSNQSIEKTMGHLNANMEISEEFIYSQDSRTNEQQSNSTPSISTNTSFSDYGKQIALYIGVLKQADILNIIQSYYLLSTSSNIAYYSHST